MTFFQGLAALAVLLTIAFALSEDRRAIPLRVVIGGVALQIVLALLFIKFPPAVAAIVKLTHGVEALQRATDAGTALVFGFLGGAPLPYAETKQGASYILAFRAFPMVLTISALATLMFYLGLMQKIVAGFAFVLRRALGVGGPLGVGAATHIFVGMVEAPLIVRPYLTTMSRGELFALMSCGMAGIAGTVMAIYGAILSNAVPGALPAIISAAIISTPAALALSALMIPFTPDERATQIKIEDPPANAFEAIVRGTMDGVKIFAGIVALMIVLVALVHLADAALSLLPDIGGKPVSIRAGFALLFRPLVWLIGVPWPESETAAMLMATKTALNEFVAYLDLAALPEGALSPHSKLIMTYALCGFANFGSLGIMIGGMTTMAPERRHDIVTLAPRSLVTGTLATLMSGAVVGMVG
ncbi:MAG: nucleoside:proton symporter [Hyphomicrobiales bacterium]|nr:nucleoside:proton symporter [Hyphomicrobiales bacterium]MCC2109072.1 nucleoside:proton symporter [Hyphomicrobiales bacterium]